MLPICSVIGHVDVGKTSFLDYFKNAKTNEVRGVTQQLTVYKYDKTHLSDYVINPVFESNFNLDGIILIDTPGHEYFTTMRTITSTISHLVIVMVDLIKGIEITHLEILKYLKSNHIDFIIVLNKMDRIYGWKICEKQTLKNSFKAQTKNSMTLLQGYINHIVCQLAEQELNACVYYNNTDYKTFISMVPISAKSGEGIGDLLILISKLFEKKYKLFEKADFYKDIRGFIVDGKIDDKFGKLFTIINHHGRISENDDVVLIGSNNKRTKHKIRHVFIKSIRVPYCENFDVAEITLDDKNIDLESGDVIVFENCERNYQNLILSQITLNFNEESEKYNTEDDKIDVICDSMKFDAFGLTIISLSKMMHGALYKLFKKEMGIPVAICTVDKLNKNIIIKTVNNNKVNNKVNIKDMMKDIKYDYYRVIIIFEPVLEENNIDTELIEFAHKNKLHIIASNSIFRLKEQYQSHCDLIKNKIRNEYAGLMDSQLEILPNCIFLKTSPLLFGIKVLSGKLNIGTKLVAIEPISMTSVLLGIVKSMEKDKKSVMVGEVKDEICIRVETLDKKIVYKVDFDESYIVKTYRTNNDNIIFNMFKDELTK